MSELVARGLLVQSLDEKARTVDFIASTDAIDSYDEVVEQDWILDRYLANPVVLFGHNSRELPVGKATRVEVVEVNGRKQLECTVAFASAKANPHAESVWQSCLEGTLRAVSVGFMPGDYRFEKRNGVEVFVLSKNTLHEISVVPIPANPEALAKMKSKARQASTPEAVEAKGDKTMNEKEMLERIAKADAEKAHADKLLADAQKEVASSKAAVAALEGTVKALTDDRDAMRARAEKAEEAGIVAEVDALVGVKIAASEKETFVELRKSNAALFTKMVATRPEMKLLGGQVIPDVDGKGAAPPVVNGNANTNGADLAAKIFG